MTQCSCGLASNATEGPTHAYVTTSPACWEIFSSLLQANTHRLFTDAYMAQHAEGDDPRQLQSVTVHLVTLHAIGHHGQDPGVASRITSAGVETGRRRGGFPKLTPPPSWPHTVADVAEARTTTVEYVDSVHQTWVSWDAETVEARTREVLEYLYGTR